jgi:hypothetical protein
MQKKFHYIAVSGTYRPLPELPSIEMTNLTNFPVLQDRQKIVSRGDSEVVKDRHTIAETPTRAGTPS